MTALLLGSWALVGCAGGGGSLSQAIEWREARLQRLTAPDGWLSLTALAWIEPGEHTLGSESGNDIVLSGGPGRLGTLTRDGDRFHLRASTDRDVRFDGEIRRSAELVPDDRGEPTRVAVDSLVFYVVKRGEYALRVKDAHAPTRVDFTELEYFPFDPAWVLEARFEAHEPSRTLPIANVLGQVDDMINPGALVFSHRGVDYRLEAVDESGDGKELFVIFGDRTNGDETYAAGRFVYTPWPRRGTTTLDLNRAYNPPCVFTEFSTCGLPPRGNRLNVTVRAGEKMYQGPAEGYSPSD